MKKYNEIQSSKNKMDLNNRKNKNDLPSPIYPEKYSVPSSPVSVTLNQQIHNNFREY